MKNQDEKRKGRRDHVCNKKEKIIAANAVNLVARIINIKKKVYF